MWTWSANLSIKPTKVALSRCRTFAVAVNWPHFSFTVKEDWKWISGVWLKQGRYFQTINLSHFQMFVENGTHTDSGVCTGSLVREAFCRSVSGISGSGSLDMRSCGISSGNLRSSLESSPFSEHWQNLIIPPKCYILVLLSCVKGRAWQYS